MADIVLTCPHCGKQTSLSEYVSETAVACQACQKMIPLPEGRQTGRSRLKLRPPTSDVQSTGLPTWSPSDAPREVSTLNEALPQKRSASARREHRRSQLSRGVVGVYWLAFLLLAAALVYLRFFAATTIWPLATIKLIGLSAIGLAYLVSIGLALSDNMFDGLLALVVPMYPFYYLFFVAQAWWLRVLVAGLLAGFGYDWLLLLQDIWLRIYTEVNYRIRNA
jgi:hypothetical protein